MAISRQEDELDAFLSEAQKARQGAPPADPIDSFLAEARSARGEGEVPTPTQPKGRKISTPEAAGGLTLDALLNLPSGQYLAAKKIVESKRKPGAKFGAYGELGETFRYAFPEATVPFIGKYDEKGELKDIPLGKKPTLADLDAVAAKDENFAKEWTALKEQKAQSEEIASLLHGEKPDWNQILGKYVTARAEAAIQDGSFPAEDPAEPPRPLDLRRAPRDESVFAGPRALQAQMGGDKKRKTLELKQTARDRFLAEVAQQGREGFPGVTRAPLSEQEIVEAGFALLRGEATTAQEALHWAGKAALRGGAQGAKLLAATALPTGKLGAFGRGAVHGAALSAGEQALGMASGAQDEFSVGRLVKDAALFGGAAKAGQLAEKLFPAFPRTAGTVGAIGTFEGAGLAEKALTGGEGDGRSFKERALEAAVAIGVGSLGGSYGRGKEVKGRAAEPERLPSNEAATRVTAAALRQNFDRLLRASPNRELLRKYEQKITDEVLPHEVAVERTNREYNDFLDRVSEGDPQKRAILADNFYRSLETEGRAPMAEILPPEQMAEGVRLLREHGRAGLGLGEVMHKNGLIPDARYRVPGEKEDVSVTADEPVPEGSKLVGGIKYHRERGFFLPQVTINAEVPEALTVSPKGRGGERGYLRDEIARGHLKARTQTFEEALQSRVLDTSPGAALRVFQSEGSMLRSKMMLNLAKEDGLVLNEADLPSADAKAAIAVDAAKLKAEIKRQEAEILKLKPIEQLVRRQELIAAKRQLAEMEDAAKGKLYQKAVGEEWGEFNGKWIHRDILNHSRSLREEQSAFGHAMSVTHGMLKTLRVAVDPSQWAQNKFGNMVHAADMGIPLGEYLKEQPHAVGLQVGKAKRELFDDEFFAQAKTASLGGSTDVTMRDMRDMSRLEPLIEKARQEGRNTAWLHIAKWIDSRHKVADKMGVAGLPFKALEKVGWANRALVDQSDALSIYRVLRKQGKSPFEAFQEVRAILDYRMLPKAVQGASNFFSFIRYSSKVVQSYLTKGAQKQPSYFGMTIPTPMDAVIRAMPGSGAAQAALVARGISRLATTGAQWVTVTLAAQAGMLKALGISKEDYDKYLDENLHYLPPQALWMAKQTSVPVSKDDKGIYSIDIGRWFPPIVAMRYFWLGGGDAPWWWDLANKNIAAGAAAQVAARKRFDFSNRAEGFGPDERWWPLIEMISPALPMKQINAYAREQRLPPEERESLLKLVQSFSGVPLSLLRNPDFRRALVRRYEEEGLLGREERSDGSWNWYVPNEIKMTPEGVEAQNLLDSMRDLPIDSFSLKQREYNRQQRKLKQLQR